MSEPNYDDFQFDPVRDVKALEEGDYVEVETFGDQSHRGYLVGKTSVFGSDGRRRYELRLVKEPGLEQKEVQELSENWWDLDMYERPVHTVLSYQEDPQRTGRVRNVNVVDPASDRSAEVGMSNAAEHFDWAGSVQNNVLASDD